MTDKLAACFLASTVETRTHTVLGLKPSGDPNWIAPWGIEHRIVISRCRWPVEDVIWDGVHIPVTATLSHRLAPPVAEPWELLIGRITGLTFPR